MQSLWFNGRHQIFQLFSFFSVWSLGCRVFGIEMSGTLACLHRDGQAHCIQVLYMPAAAPDACGLSLTWLHVLLLCISFAVCDSCL